MRASRGLKWENKMYKLRRFIADSSMELLQVRHNYTICNSALHYETKKKTNQDYWNKNHIFSLDS